MNSCISKNYIRFCIISEIDSRGIVSAKTPLNVSVCDCVCMGVCVCVYRWACVWPLIISTICHIRTPLERRVIFTVARPTSLVWIEVERRKKQIHVKATLPPNKKNSKDKSAWDLIEEITFIKDFRSFFLCCAFSSLEYLQEHCYRLTMWIKKNCLTPIIILALTQLQN